MEDSSLIFVFSSTWLNILWDLPIFFSQSFLKKSSSLTHLFPVDLLRFTNLPIYIQWKWQYNALSRHTPNQQSVCLEHTHQLKQSSWRRHKQTTARFQTVLHCPFMVREHVAFKCFWTSPWTSRAKIFDKTFHFEIRCALTLASLLRPLLGYFGR